jgi:gamma-glutamyltranspeptidase/glutathione hydrolase
LPLAAPSLARSRASAKIFLHPDRTPLARGERLVQTDLAVTLEAVGRDGPPAFYSGPVAEKIAAAVQAAGGVMTAADLASYQAVEREPVHGTYRGYDIYSMPPPSSGGIHVIEILNILEGFGLTALGQNSADTIHLMAEALQLAYADRATYLGDPDFVHVPVAGLTSKKYAETLRAGILATRTRPSSEIKAGNPAPYESEQTTHFSVVDADGNAVSNTYTLNFFYGVGLVADGTGVLLNNELDDFSAKPGTPNAFGLVGGSANAPAPRKRPLSSMSPTMVFKDGQLFLVTGARGGSFIITAVVQILLDVIDHGMNVAEAMEAPRVHHQWLPDELRVERGLSIDTIRLLEARGHHVVTKSSMGSTETIMRAGGLLLGAADTRERGGLAAGY